MKRRLDLPRAVAAPETGFHDLLDEVSLRVMSYTQPFHPLSDYYSRNMMYRSDALQHYLAQAKVNVSWVRQHLVDRRFDRLLNALEFAKRRGVVPSPPAERAGGVFFRPRLADFIAVDLASGNLKSLTRIFAKLITDVAKNDNPNLYQHHGELIRRAKRWPFLTLAYTAYDDGVDVSYLIREVLDFQDLLYFAAGLSDRAAHDGFALLSMVNISNEYNEGFVPPSYLLGAYVSGQLQAKLQQIVGFGHDMDPASLSDVIDEVIARDDVDTFKIIPNVRDTFFMQDWFDHAISHDGRCRIGPVILTLVLSRDVRNELIVPMALMNDANVHVFRHLMRKHPRDYPLADLIGHVTPTPTIVARLREHLEWLLERDNPDDFVGAGLDVVMDTLISWVVHAYQPEFMVYFQTLEDRDLISNAPNFQSMGETDKLDFYLNLPRQPDNDWSHAASNQNPDWRGKITVKYAAAALRALRCDALFVMNQPYPPSKLVFDLTVDEYDAIIAMATPPSPMALFESGTAACMADSAVRDLVFSGVHKLIRPSSDAVIFVTLQKMGISFFYRATYGKSVTDFDRDMASMWARSTANPRVSAQTYRSLILDRPEVVEDVVDTLTTLDELGKTLTMGGHEQICAFYRVVHILQHIMNTLFMRRRVYSVMMRRMEQQPRSTSPKDTSSLLALFERLLRAAQISYLTYNTPMLREAIGLLNDELGYCQLITNQGLSGDLSYLDEPENVIFKVANPAYTPGKTSEPQFIDVDEEAQIEEVLSVPWRELTQI